MSQLEELGCSEQCQLTLWNSQLCLVAIWTFYSSEVELAEERHQLPSAAVPKVALRFFWMGLNKEKMRKSNNAQPFCLYFNNVSFNDRNVLSHKPDSHLWAFCFALESDLLEPPTLDPWPQPCQLRQDRIAHYPKPKETQTWLSDIGRTSCTV